MCTGSFSRSRRIVLPALLLMLVFHSSLLFAGGAEAWGGKAFSDPAKTVTMPAAWKNRPPDDSVWPSSADLTVSLDQHLYPALKPFLEQFARERNLHIELREGTCGISAGLLSAKQVDIAGYCCPPGPNDRLPGLRFHTVAIGALAIYVHPANSVNDISLSDARRLFRGDIYRWGELGATDPQDRHRPIYATARLHCKQRPGHWRLLLDSEASFSGRLHVVGTIQDEFHHVADNPMAAGGFETLYMAEHHYGMEDELKPLRLDGVSPRDREALASGRYPLYFTFNLTSWERPEMANPLAARLVEYLIRQADDIDPVFGMVSSRQLRRRGWKFMEDELTGGNQSQVYNEAVSLSPYR